jgi:N-dimethylarginine dimethylaminohydrolase
VAIKMGATFVMSYPASDWRVVSSDGAAANPRAQRGPANPRAALTEWIALADAIVYAGGRIVVCEPAPGAGSPTGLPYTADWGVLIRRNDQPLFLLPKAQAEHRAAERHLVRAFFDAAGVPVQDVPCAFSGRGDLVQVGPGRYGFIAGVRADASAAGVLAKELGEMSRYVEARVRAPFAFGDEVLASCTNKAGDIVIIAHEGGMAGRTIPDLRASLTRVEVIPVDADDAAAGACTSLCVNGTIIHPPELSTTLRGNLIRRGFQLVELPLPELFGKGGGGLHALVNELVGFVIGTGAPDYTRARDRIAALVETYPETSPEAPTPA